MKAPRAENFSVRRNTENPGAKTLSKCFGLDSDDRANGGMSEQIVPGKPAAWRTPSNGGSMAFLVDTVEDPLTFHHPGLENTSIVEVGARRSTHHPSRCYLGMPVKK
jgi:hypothetical protein